LTVDGVHCPIEEPRQEPSAKWHSHKFHGAGLAYELGISVFENKLVWINGPYPCGDSDLVIFRKEDGLRSKIPPGKKVIADRGYSGDDQPMLALRNKHDTDEVKDFKSRACARHESFNTRIKSFACLTKEFRHGKDNHRDVFFAACVLKQYDLENGHPLFDV